MPFEEILGNGQSFALRDIGLGEGIPGKPISLKNGRYACAFEWHGRNWDGPSDTDAGQGAPFPPGTYTLTVRLLGWMDSPDGCEGYQVSQAIPVTLNP